MSTARTSTVLGHAATFALAAALILFCSFRAGGFFPGTPALVAVAALVVLVLHVATAPAPFAGAGRGLAAAAVPLGLLAGWMLLSGAWSDAPGRAIVEADRALAYLLVLLAFGCAPFTPERLRWALCGVAAGIVVVAIAALASRLVPDVVSTTENIYPERLSWPLTYWNALGLQMAVGLVLCLHLGADGHEPAGVRVAATAVLPALAATALLTLSRGALVVALAGAAAYLALARPRLALAALASGLVPVAVAVVAAYRADLLASPEPSSPAAVGQGHRLALVLAACMLFGGVLRAVLITRLDARLALRGPRVPSLRRPAVAALALLALAGAAVVAARQYDRFVAAPSAAPADARNRLTDSSSNGRLEYWDVALDGLVSAPLAGTGAGTFQLEWWKRRDEPSPVQHAHSLYLETAAELGAVGLVLLLAALAGLALGVRRRRRGPARAAAAALTAAGLAWALHAALDWDWQMPAVTAWLFAVGGVALARDAGPPERALLGRRRWRPPARLAAGAALLCAAAAPALVAVSQSRTDRALAAYDAGDCAAAETAADVARAAVPVRAEPDAILAWCAAREGRMPAAEEAIDRAIRHDPRDWQLRHSQALIRGAAGRDPRPAVAAALARNAREPELQALAAALATDDPRTWKRRALEARLFLQGLDHAPLAAAAS